MLRLNAGFFVNSADEELMQYRVLAELLFSLLILKTFFKIMI